jgi:vancomycin resistance protein YoaR
MIRFKKIYIIGFLFLFSPFFISSSFAAPANWTKENIRLKYEYQHFFLVNPYNYIVEKEISHNDTFCTDEEESDEGENEKQTEWEVDTKKIEVFLEETGKKWVDMPSSDVKIYKDENQKIKFEGYGQDGVELDTKKSAELIAFAIKNNISQVNLAVSRVPAAVNVEDEELKKMGIKEVISVGRSDFYPSSASRIQNIMTGASRFNGYIIEPGSEFSFNTQLGKVDGSTGYAKEYVILGPKVVPEYGGGLCQVSSTAYRGVMIAGLEIVERHNHSFAVNHYKPYGSDATIYQGVKDFRFKNDTPNAILIQTRRGEGKFSNELFFHYYGTKPNREVKILGPVMNNFRNPLPAKTTYTTEIPAGSSQTVSSPVRGFNSSFERLVLENNQEKFNDTFFSPYQPRGLWVLRGQEENAPTETSALSSNEASRINSSGIVDGI